MSTLPKGWTRTALEDLVRPKSERVSPTTQPDAPYIGLEHVQAHTNVILGTVSASSMTSSSASFDVGDILYGRMRPYLNKVVRPTFSGLASAEFIIFPKSEAIDSCFLLKRISSIDFVEFACSQYEGDRPRVKFDALGKFQIDLPPIPEQTRIVTKLEELLTDLDAGVAELKTAQKKLAQYRQSLLKAAVEGALTAQWREDNPTTESGAQLLERILLERRARWEAKQLAKFAEQGKTPPKEWQKKYPEPVQPDTTDLPQLPEGWVWASVQLLGDVQLGRQRSPEKMKGISPTPYIRAANITEAGIDLDDVLEMDFSEQERNVFQLQAGDVLLTEASGSAEHVGRPAIWPNIDGLYCFQNTVLRFKPQCVSSEFAFYSFLAMQKLGVFSKLSGGVGINHLSAGKFSKLPLALPASSEQAVIVKTLKSQLAGVEEQHLAIALALNQSVAQRQNILRAAFSGQLVPQDPNDQPASVLLERIRAQRAEQAKQPKPRKTKKKESSTVARKLVDVLTEASDWLPAQEAFRRCGIADGAQTEEIEALYAELRALDKSQHLSVKAVFDLVDTPEGKKHRKVADHLKWVG